MTTILVGLDDCDMPGTPGTNQLARALVAHLSPHYRCRQIVRHQLLTDPRVPCTSKNGAASITLTTEMPESLDALGTRLADWLCSRVVEGSDPGLCVCAAADVIEAVRHFGRRCQNELVTQADALRCAEQAGIWLTGLSGTRDGLIGALAAVGLAATGEDGRVVQLGLWPDDLSGWQPISTLLERGLLIREMHSGRLIEQGTIDVGKKLRPNLRGGRWVLFVQPGENGAQKVWHAVRLP